MASTLSILSSAASATADRALAKFARFLGLQAELLAIDDESGGAIEPLLADREPNGFVLAIGQSTLRSAMDRDWFVRLLARSRFCFVYGFAATDGNMVELKWLTGGAVTSVMSTGAGSKHLTVHSNVRHDGFAVSGASCELDTECLAFGGVSRANETETYISVDGRPHFVATTRAGVQIFLLAERTLVDIDSTLAPEASLRPWYAQLVAMAIFLRAAFGNSCWSAPVTAATFILDDPYLKKRYGFVRYADLVKALQSTGGALTVAFIPYNYRRSDPRTVALLKSHAERFSIAVHGCDHTGGEFASLNEGWLAGTADCALELMQAHSRLSGMPFDNVMVFPQGRFSTKAVGALKRAGFAAAVNTTAWPEDYGERPLTMRDCLDVAVTKYEYFPIFQRRYPRDMFDYAFDALFQKPVLVVEHHGFFRRGYESFGEVIRKLSGLPTKLTWMPLGQTVSSSCLYRQTGHREGALRQYSAALVFRNPTVEPLSISVEKPEQNEVVEAVVVGATKVPFDLHSGLLKYDVRLEPGEQIDIRVLYRGTRHAARRPPLKYRVTASARRRLSEVRDNYLARSERVLAVAEKIKRVVAPER